MGRHRRDDAPDELGVPEASGDAHAPQDHRPVPADALYVEQQADSEADDRDSPGETLSARPARRRWIAVGLLLLASVLAIAGVALIRHGTKHTAAPAAPLPSKTFSLDPAVVAALPPVTRRLNPAPGATGPAAAAPCASSPRPNHVVIAALCIDAPIVPEVIRGNELIIPDDVHQVGLWAQGAGTSATAGTTLLAGHVNFVGQGDGAFADLYRSEPGVAISLVDGAGTVRTWRAISMTVVSKSTLPPAVFAGTAGPRRLVLVTCGGPVDFVPGYGYSYRDNVIVTAVPAP